MRLWNDDTATSEAQSYYLLPIKQEAYHTILNDAVKFRQWLMENYRCPAEKLNKKRYHKNWLQNLL
ncbi:MAG: hypothetical protein LBT09_08810, partial [Planctomycetaceae bacterium]|nr:hypothetical protein [Planctomycetaceae bacterium]